MKIPIRGVAGWMLFILGSSRVDASDAVRFCLFFLHLGILCGGRGDYGSFILVPLKKTWGILLWECSPFLHRHANVDDLDSGIAVHSTDKKTQCKSEAREVKKKREGPCSTSVLNSEGGGRTHSPQSVVFKAKKKQRYGAP